MSCRCGYDFRTDTDEELAAVTYWHLVTEHPSQPSDGWLYAKSFPDEGCANRERDDQNSPL